jgi:hypothetical protein
MKIRTDFVTNSSSSSYCVSFSVNTAENEEIRLDFKPDKDENTKLYLKTDMQVFLSELRECTTVPQLRDFLLNAVRLDDLFFEVIGSQNVDTSKLDNKQHLELVAKTIEETEDGEDWFADDCRTLKTITQKITNFSNSLDGLTALDAIQSVSICEDFSGWGEFAYDVFERFLSKTLTSYKDSQNPDAVRAALQPYLESDKIEFILEQLADYSIGLCDASIVTTIQLLDGLQEKKYDFHADNGSKWC